MDSVIKTKLKQAGWHIGFTRKHFRSPKVIVSIYQYTNPVGKDSEVWEACSSSSMQTTGSNLVEALRLIQCLSITAILDLWYATK